MCAVRIIQEIRNWAALRGEQNRIPILAIVGEDVVRELI
jgi:hypothetical protein